MKDLFRFTVIAFGVVFTIACKVDGGDADADCGDQVCPAGTAFEVYAESRVGINLTASGSAGIDGNASGQLGYANYGEGECRYSCVAFAACPDGTWPVISNECYTCALLDDNGEVTSVECGD